MGKKKTKEKLKKEYQDELEKDDSWKNRIEMTLLEILDELKVFNALQKNKK